MKALLILYNALFPVVLLLLLPKAVYRMLRRGQYSHRFGQRFGLYSKNTLARLRSRRGDWIWVHAVSVGEVLVAVKFIRELQRDRDVPVLLTTTTTTGYELARRHKNKQIEVIYHPVDCLFCVKKAVGTVRPKALVLVEAEVWPNLTAMVRRMGAPVVLINARLSPRSGDRYRRFRWLAGPLFRSLDAICLQESLDKNRFEAIGALPERLLLTGSIKFDIEGDAPPSAASCRAQLDALGIAAERPILLGASTHPGEEALLGRVFQRLRAEMPELFCVIVPRHFERGARAAAELEKLGLRVARSAASPSPGCDVLLADRTGELRKWTSLASVVFVGKSLLAEGGQNPSEAIIAEKPLVFGPHMQNFQALVDIILRHDGARQVADEEELFLACRELLLHPTAAQSMTRRALAALDPHRGAARRTIGILDHLLSRGKSESPVL